MQDTKEWISASYVPRCACTGKASTWTLSVPMKTCSVCQTNQSSQQAETLLPHDIPDGLWQVLATDIFHLDGNDYVIVADYYSKMPFVRHLTSNSTSATVISALKQLFGEHGIPCKLLFANVPQYNCVEFRTFAADWGFKHVTSSPRYPQSNGFAEHMVQTVKKTMLKAKAEQYRSIPFSAVRRHHPH